MQLARMPADMKRSHVTETHQQPVRRCGRSQPGALPRTRPTLYSWAPAAQSHIPINLLVTQCAQQDPVMVLWAPVARATSRKSAKSCLLGIASAHLPNRQSSGTNALEYTILVLLDEFLQPVDASVDRSDDLKRGGFSFDETPKHTMCIVGHGGWGLWVDKQRPLWDSEISKQRD
jgi:hypothetical protein